MCVDEWYFPFLAGVGGNLVAVQSSRISTGLHKSGSPLGKLPKQEEFRYHGILRTFGCSKCPISLSVVCVSMVIM